MEREREKKRKEKKERKKRNEETQKDKDLNEMNNVKPEESEPKLEKKQNFFGKAFSSMVNTTKNVMIIKLFLKQIKIFII